MCSLTKCGYAWSVKREFDKANADYTELIRLRPRTHICWHRPRRCSDGRRGIRTRPSPTSTRRFGSTRKTVMGYISRGGAWHRNGELNKAIADYSEAIRLNPKHPAAYV